jgi:quercetin dioxygenase-like cupin family protein
MNDTSVLMFRMGVFTVDDFPDFMKCPDDAISSSSQSAGVRGWVYDGAGGNQMAYWICETDGVSREHVHPYDEYVTVVQGSYTLVFSDRRFTLCRGDETMIPAQIPHAGEFTAGTRTIHCFGGRRAERSSQKPAPEQKSRVMP